MDDKPLELLPFGRTLEQQNAIDAKKARGLAGLHGCLLQAALFAFVAIICALYVRR